MLRKIKRSDFKSKSNFHFMITVNSPWWKLSDERKDELLETLQNALLSFQDDVDNLLNEEDAKAKPQVTEFEAHFELSEKNDYPHVHGLMRFNDFARLNYSQIHKYFNKFFEDFGASVKFEARVFRNDLDQVKEYIKKNKFRII